MENIFKVQKTARTVLPSGVAAEIRGLEGKHQALITSQDEKKRIKGLKTILWDCLRTLGNSNSIPEDYVDKLTSFDRKFLLWEIRRISNEDTKRFVFDYEFPTDNQRKLKQRFEVEFTNESFPVTPAKWVREKMLEDLMLETGNENLTENSTEFKNKVYSGDFPVCYDNYDAMLEERAKKTLKLPECGVEIYWNLATGKDEDRLTNMKVETNSHTQLHLHSPKYKDMQRSTESKEVIQPVPLDDLCNRDIEELRKDIMSYEGNVDSMIVVQSDEDSSKIAQVDLLQTPAFFFASLAL